jgi:hypothetical protein
MKYLLFTALVCAPMLIFAQSKSGSFIKEHLYVKASPTLFVQGSFDGGAYPKIMQNEKPTPAVLGTIGYKIRFAALGFSAGYMKFKEAGGVIPWGADLTLTDFKGKKLFPVITAQWHKTNFTERYSRGGYAAHYYDISGKDMYSVGAGVAFRAWKSSKIMATVGYSQLKSDVNISYSSDPGQFFTSNMKDHLDMFFIAASYVW